MLTTVESAGVLSPAALPGPTADRLRHPWVLPGFPLPAWRPAWLALPSQLRPGACCMLEAFIPLLSSPENRILTPLADKERPFLLLALCPWEP